jgi:uncharacterized protein
MQLLQLKAATVLLPLLVVRPPTTPPRAHVCVCAPIDVGPPAADQNAVDLDAAAALATPQGLHDVDAAATLATPHDLDDVDAAAVLATRRWIKEVVIRLGLCPYASDVYHTDGQIRYVVSHATSDEELIDDFFQEAVLLLDSPSDELATTMLAAPLYEGGIEPYYSLYEWLVDILEDEDEEILQNQVQPAFFHPEWTFAGVDQEEAIHFEKRAPYPVINLLRRAQLDEAVQKGLDRGVIVNKQIAEHNAAALTREGYSALEACFRALHERH